MHTLLSTFGSNIVPKDFIEQVKNGSINLKHWALFAAIFLFGILLISTLFRFLFGKKAQIQIAVSSALEIFVVYIIAIVVCTLGASWSGFFTSLPLVSIADQHLYFYPVLNSDFTLLCSQLLHLLTIAFVVNLVSSVISHTKHLWSRLLLRLLVVAIAIGAIYGLNILLNNFIPQDFTQHAPKVLLLVLAALILLGSMRLLVGTAIAFVSPILGVLYTFFFSNIIGRALSRAILTTALLTGLVIALNALGIYWIPISTSGLLLCLPMLLVGMLVWFLISHLFQKKS